MSTLISYKKLVEELEATGFKINPYAAYIAIKVINSHQMTMMWHLNDLKVSHKDPYQLSELALYLSKMYGNVSVKCGKVHDYLSQNF